MNKILFPFHGSYSLVNEYIDQSDPDNHRFEEDTFAKRHGIPLELLRRQTAATGALDCEQQHVFATANLIRPINTEGPSDVIVTSGHVFMNESTCKRQAIPESCVFIPRIGTVNIDKQAVRVKALIKSGYSCAYKSKEFSDWAILKLEKKVENIEPYKFELKPFGLRPTETPDPDKMAIKPGQAVVQVAAYAIDFSRIDSGKKRIYPKNFQDCHIKKIDYFSVRTNCDSDIWSSGGAILDMDFTKTPILVALITSGSKGEDVDFTVKTGKATRKPYDEDRWTDFVMPLSNLDFVLALREVFDIWQ